MFLFPQVFFFRDKKKHSFMDSQIYKDFKSYINYNKIFITEDAAKILFITTIFDDKWKSIFTKVYGNKYIPEHTIAKVNQYIENNSSDYDRRLKVIGDYISSNKKLNEEKYSGVRERLKDSELSEFISDIERICDKEAEKLSVSNVFMLALGLALDNEVLVVENIKKTDWKVRQNFIFSVNDGQISSDFEDNHIADLIRCCLVE